MDTVTRTLVAALETLQETLDPGLLLVHHLPPKPHSWKGQSTGSNRSSRSSSSSLSTTHHNQTTTLHSGTTLSPISKRKRGGAPTTTSHNNSSEPFVTDDDYYAVKSRRLTTGLSMYFTNSLSLQPCDDENRDCNDQRMDGGSSSPIQPTLRESRSDMCQSPVLMNNGPGGVDVMETTSAGGGTDMVGFSPPRQPTKCQHDFELRQRAHEVCVCLFCFMKR